MTTRLHRRGGFTLMELIIVIGIIVLLLSLTAAAVFRLRGSQMEKNTNTHLLKIHSEFEKQWTAAVDRIKKENPPPAVIELTKNADGTPDIARAKAFHLKMRLRQEFPQNFGELFLPAPLVTVPSPTGSYVYGPKSAFKTAIKNPWQNPPASNIYPEPVDGSGNTIQEAQAAALLLLILSQGQGGSTSTPESIAPTKVMDFRQVQGSPVQLRVFVDEWGTPISFRRLADDDMADVLSDLNPQFAGVMPPNPLPSSLDPQDPDGRLLLPNVKWFQPPTGPNYRDVAKAYLANNSGTRPILADPFDGRNRGPFVFSAGGNKQFWTSSGSMETNLDNLYSYRLAQSGRGN